MRQLRKQIVLGVATVLIGFAGVSAAIGFLCLGLFFYFATFMTGAAAAALAGVAVFVAAMLIILVVRWAARRRPAPQQQSAGAPKSDIAAELGNLIGRQARGFATRHAGATVVSSLALGFMIGLNPGLRDLLRREL